MPQAPMRTMQIDAARRGLLQGAATRLSDPVLQRAGNRQVCENSCPSLLTPQRICVEHISVRVRGRRGTATEVCAYAATDD